MAAVQNLCSRSILLDKGQIAADGQTRETISIYTSVMTNLAKNDRNLENLIKRSGNKSVIFSSFHIENDAGQIIDHALNGNAINLVFRLKVNDQHVRKISVGFSLHDPHDDLLTYLYSDFQDKFYSTQDIEEGYLTIRCLISDFPFAPGSYLVRGRIMVDNEEADWPVEPIGIIYIEMGDFYNNGKAIAALGSFLIKGVWN
jgi:lipopolysaccharide transport system ATP-binding protein